MLHAGQRDTLIIVERATVTENGLGEEVSTWAEFTRGYAVRRWGSGAERLERAQLRGAQGATFTVLVTPEMANVTLGDRINDGGTIWNIAARADISRHEIAFTVERVV